MFYFLMVVFRSTGKRQQICTDRLLCEFIYEKILGNGKTKIGISNFNFTFALVSRIISVQVVNENSKQFCNTSHFG